VVCATHQDLQAQIRDGRFREDLYYRLAELVVAIPPLRERPGDAALLAQAFLRRIAQEQRRNLAFTEDALAAIDRHAWPGNVRELLNVVKRAAIMADGPRVAAADLGLAASAPGAEELADVVDLRTARERAERTAVIAALARTGDNIARAAELLGVSRPTLYDLMHRHAIKT